MINVKIDNSQIQKFARGSPKRAEWAMKEALSMAGGHVRKDFRQFVESQLSGMAPLHPVTRAGRKAKKSPLYGLGKMISFKYGKSKGVQQVQIGWIGKGQPALVKKLFYGKRFRATPKIRALFHHRGVHLKKQTKTLEIPRRDVVGAFWRRKAKQIPVYVERRFFEKFFGKGKPGLKI